MRMILHQLSQQARQVSRKAAKLRHAVAAERKGMLVLNNPKRTQSRKMIGVSGRPSHTCKLKNKMNQKTLSQLLKTQAQQAIVYQEQVGVDCSLLKALKKKVTATTIKEWDPD